MCKKSKAKSDKMEKVKMQIKLLLYKKENDVIKST